MQMCLCVRERVQEATGPSAPTPEAGVPPAAPVPPPAPAAASGPGPTPTCHGGGADDGDLRLTGVQVERDVAHDNVDSLYQAQHDGVVLQTTQREGTEQTELAGTPPPRHTRQACRVPLALAPSVPRPGEEHPTSAEAAAGQAGPLDDQMGRRQATTPLAAEHPADPAQHRRPGHPGHRLQGLDPGARDPV